MDRKSLWREYHELGPAAFWKKRADNAQSEPAREAFLELAWHHEERPLTSERQTTDEVGRIRELAEFFAKGPSRLERLKWWLDEKRPAWKANVLQAFSLPQKVLVYLIPVGTLPALVLSAFLIVGTFWGLRFHHSDGGGIEFVAVILGLVTILAHAIVSNEDSELGRVVWGCILIFFWGVPSVLFNFVLTPVSPDPYFRPDSRIAFVMKEASVMDALQFGAPDDAQWRVKTVEAYGPFKTDVRWVDLNQGDLKANDVTYTPGPEGPSTTRVVHTTSAEYMIRTALAKPIALDPAQELVRFKEAVARSVDSVTPDDRPVGVENLYLKAVQRVKSPLFRATDVTVQELSPGVEVLLWGEWRSVEVEPEEIPQE